MQNTLTVAPCGISSGPEALTPIASANDVKVSNQLASVKRVAGAFLDRYKASRNTSDQAVANLQRKIALLKTYSLIAAVALSIAGIAVGVFLLFNPATLGFGIALIACSSSVLLAIAYNQIKGYRTGQRQAARNHVHIVDPRKESGRPVPQSLAEIDRTKASYFGMPSGVQNNANVLPYRSSDFGQGSDEFAAVTFKDDDSNFHANPADSGDTLEEAFLKCKRNWQQSNPNSPLSSFPLKVFS